MIYTGKFEKVLKAVYNFLVIFAVIAFITTCCTMLFVSVMTHTLDITLTDENLSLAARLTFANVILLSLIFTAIDIVRKKITVDRPVKQITQGAEKIMGGDFSVQIKKFRSFEADDKFNEIIQCFNKMAQELSGIETLRTDFISNVSHELKTPLAVMQNYATMLQAPNLTEDKRIEYAKAISSSSRRLAELITNVLKLNKLENQHIFTNISAFNLSDQLCECLLQFEDLWENKNIDIDTDIQDQVIINSDPELLSIVWNNLFSNAIKFTPQGGKVSVSLKSIGGSIYVKVSDTGCGMSPETGKHIFEKFYQGDTSHATQGSGLGLALVKRIIDITKSDISVESQAGKGSTFTVKLRRNADGES